MKEYIKTSVSKNQKEYYLFNKIPIFILNKLPIDININQIIQSLEDHIPAFMFEGIDGIYVGEFEELKNRNIQALFKDDAIYLSSFKDLEGISEEWIVRDIAHELAHSVEERFTNEIYSDDKIENEYNAKKEKLYWLLVNEGYHFPKDLLFNDELVDEFDDFLYKKIGYDKLSLLIPGLFLSPYSITSIREYFATGFEHYYLKDRNYLKTISPKIYQKINYLETLLTRGDL